MNKSRGSKYLWYIETWGLYNIKQTNNKMLLMFKSCIDLNKVIDNKKAANKGKLLFKISCEKWRKIPPPKFPEGKLKIYIHIKKKIIKVYSLYKLLRPLI